jgi:phage shock protein PspC (stress-responsive transcriptional regulator)
MVASSSGAEDGDMNQTSDSPGGSTAAPPPPDGPRVSPEQMRDLRRLRRSRSDRKISGVAGGLGRHLDIDPTVIRVVLVVLCFFGGAGFLLYGALWLLVPADGAERAVVNTSDDLQKGLLIGAGVLAAIFILGEGWGGWWSGPGLPLGLVAVLAVVWLVLRERKRETPQPPYAGPPAAGMSTYAAVTGSATGPVTATPQGGYASATPAGGYAPASGGTGYTPPPSRPAWAPPPYVPPAPRPRRTGLVLFWPTLALVAIGLGALGIYDAAGNNVAQAAYAALALGVIGVMLVVGAFVGRPGGLTLLGVIAALTLAVGNVTGGFHEGRSATYTPVSAQTVQSSYDMKTGELVLDLSRVSDLAPLDGRSIRIDGNAGRIEVVVPSGLTVDVNADIRYAGGITIGDRNNGGGVNPSASETVGGHFGDPTLNLEIDLRVGEIDVRQQ